MVKDAHSAEVALERLGRKMWKATRAREASHIGDEFD
jgi:hypothetical protein